MKKLGKQCCSKVKSKVIRRTVAAEAVQTWADKIWGLSEDIEKLKAEETLERELRLADMLTDKSDNMQKHKDAIHGRPAKQWHMTNGSKRQLREKDSERVWKEQDQDVQEASAASAPKKRKEPPTEEEIQAKRRKRARERMVQKKEEAKAEREESEARIRASARKMRRSLRPVKGGEAPKTVAQLMNEKRMKKKEKKKGRH